MELFTQKRVSSFQPIREEELTNLIQRIDSQQGSSINITQLVVSSTFAIIARAVFGNKCKVQEFESLENGESIAGGFDLAELFPSAKWLQRVSGYRPKLERFHRQIDQILENIIIEHKEAKSKAKEGQGKGEDLVDVLLNFQGSNDSYQDICLTDNNIKAIIL
ncbi:cytochrome P450 71D11-like, partial [Trifolium medium]|nr:cytochrome P450 71D11-like [Trifolium medium]